MGVGCCFLLQGIFQTQGSNPRLLCPLHWHPLHWQAGSLPLAPPGKPYIYLSMNLLRKWSLTGVPRLRSSVEAGSRYRASLLTLLSRMKSSRFKSLSPLFLPHPPLPTSPQSRGCDGEEGEKNTDLCCLELHSS